jgi:hypothetical protein
VRVSKRIGVLEFLGYLGKWRKLEVDDKSIGVKIREYYVI